MGIIVAVIMPAGGNAKIPKSRPLWALFLPIGAALVRSIGHILTKIGRAHIPDPYFAGLVGFSVSALVVIAVRPLRPAARRVPWQSRVPYCFDLHRAQQIAAKPARYLNIGLIAISANSKP